MPVKMGNTNSTLTPPTVENIYASIKVKWWIKMFIIVIIIVCMYVCVCVRACVCACVRACVRTYVRTYVCMYVCMYYVCMCVCLITCLVIYKTYTQPLFIFTNECSVLFLLQKNVLSTYSIVF